MNNIDNIIKLVLKKNRMYVKKWHTDRQMSTERSLKKKK